MPPSLSLDTTLSVTGPVDLEEPFRLFSNIYLSHFRGGAFSYCAPHCALVQVTVGRYCSIGAQATILSMHPTQALTTSPFPYQRLFDPPFDLPPKMAFDPLGDTVIGNDVWIGSGVYIKPGVRIGDGAIIGAGSVVTRDVPPYMIVGGTPAKLIRPRFPEPLIERLLAVAWWQYNIVGLDLPHGEAAATLDHIEALVEKGELRPYVGQRYAIFREGDAVKGRPIRE